MNLKIRYKNNRLYTNLVIGILWSVLFVSGLLVDNIDKGWQYYLYFIFVMIYLGQYFFESYYHYLIIKDDTITKPELFNNKSTKLSDITEIYKYKGDYIICNAETKINLSKNMIDPESYRKLSKFIDDYSAINQITLKEHLV